MDETLTDEEGVLDQNEANSDRGAYSSSSELVDEGLARETPLSSGYERIRISAFSFSRDL